MVQGEALRTGRAQTQHVHICADRWISKVRSVNPTVSGLGTSLNISNLSKNLGRVLGAECVCASSAGPATY